MSGGADPLRILHLCGNVGRSSGGLGAVAYGAAQAQHDQGHAPAIWTLDGFAEAPENEGAVHASTFPWIGPARLGYTPAMERAAASARGAAFDVVHQHDIWQAVTRATQRWRAAHGRPTVVAPHGTLEPFALRTSRPQKRLAWLAYDHADLRAASCLHATSAAELASLRAGAARPGGGDPQRRAPALLETVGNGARFRARHGIGADTRLLVFVSRIAPKKGLPLLFRAMAGAGEALAGWRLAVCGFEDPPGYRAQLERLAEELGITRSIVWAGPVHDGGRHDAYDAADLFVLPTHNENFALVVPEALAARRPVLTTQGAPWRGLRTHRCGWWVEVGEEPIRAALVQAARTPSAELRAMGERGRALVAEKYTWPPAAAQMIELYEWLLGRRDVPGFVVFD